jgi:hypothetical protein
MANVKQVTIQGKLPFDFAFPTVIEANEKLEVTHARAEVKDWLARMNTPTFGLAIYWMTDGPKDMRPNECGGRTAWYGFVISGAEALSWECLQEMANAFRVLGEIDSARALDIESGEGEWADLGNY